MATAVPPGPFATKPAEQLVAETGEDGGLRRAARAALAIGLAIYFTYGRTHSRLQRGDTEPVAGPVA